MAKRFLFVILAGGLLGGLLLWPAATVAAQPARQVGSPTPPPLRVEAFEDVNVRGGPGTDYDRIGSLVAGQSGAILGQTKTVGIWLKIEYVGGPDNTGWVAKDLVRVIGDLTTAPNIQPPPTPTLPPVPTLEAPAANITDTVGIPSPARLPTFTPAPPVVRPTLLPAQGAREENGFPPAVFIISLFVLGLFGGFISLLQRR